VSILLHATVYAFLHNLLNVLVQIENKMGLQKKYWGKLDKSSCTSAGAQKRRSTLMFILVHPVHTTVTVGDHDI
jgi:hypothetical protein